MESTVYVASETIVFLCLRSQIWRNFGQIWCTSELQGTMQTRKIWCYYSPFFNGKQFKSVMSNDRSLEQIIMRRWRITSKPLVGACLFFLRAILEQAGTTVHPALLFGDFRILSQMVKAWFCQFLQRFLKLLVQDQRASGYLIWCLLMCRAWKPACLLQVLALK